MSSSIKTVIQQIFSGKIPKRGKRFAYADFSTGSSFSCKFTTLTNRKLIGFIKLLSGALYITTLLTLDNGAFLPANFANFTTLLSGHLMGADIL